MNRTSLFLGFLLIAAGALLLADNFGYLDYDWYRLWHYWPLLLIAGGVLFWLGWLGNRKEHGLLLPGTILIVYGALFWYNVTTGWWHMEHLWPFFMIGPGLGFFAMYLFGDCLDGWNTSIKHIFMVQDRKHAKRVSLAGHGKDFIFGVAGEDDV